MQHSTNLFERLTPVIHLARLHACRLDRVQISGALESVQKNTKKHQAQIKKFNSARLERDNQVAKLKGATSRKIYTHNYLSKLMKMDPKVEEILSPMRQEVKEQGDLVRKLKEENAVKSDIDAAVRVLLDKKRALEAKQASLVSKESFVHKTRLDEVVKQLYFYRLSFGIYGGVSGLYDYGTPGVRLMKNILQLWDSHFCLEEDLQEFKGTQQTPEPVLKASGHVERFADLMVQDLKTGEHHRLDHLIKDHLEKESSAKDCSTDKRRELDRILAQLDGLSKEQLFEVVKKFGIKAPATGNDLSEPVEFNLMFSTSIGPTGLIKSFLRPETAQGIFVNFSGLLDVNHGKLPFGVAQIGTASRNEIAPRGGLVRMREFTMAEIEYFVDPQNKKHTKYNSVKSLKLNLYSARNQMNGEDSQYITLEEAVNSETVDNEVLAYFIGRIHLFMLKIGIDQSKIRFRQHMENEMAHYATDCWDCECETSAGWLECVGCADRSCYDLTQHAKATGQRLCAHRSLKDSKEVEFVECVTQNALLGKALKSDSKLVINELQNAKEEQLRRWEKELESGMIKLNIGGQSFEITNDMISIKKTTKTVKVEPFVPSVIEPSFGIDRIIYSVLEHNFKIRDENSNRTYFSFPPEVAPFKCSVLPLSNNEVFNPFIDGIMKSLKSEGVVPKLDASSGSIGKRYSRTDELGVPFGITIDFDTVKDNTVTLRHCSSTEQVRVDISAIASLVRDLTTGRSEWSDAKKLWPEFIGQSETLTS